MKTERLVELLAYAKVCFDKCTNPFETTHLIKKNVTADECRDLSFAIAEAIEEKIEWEVVPDKVVKIIKKAMQDFAETQT